MNRVRKALITGAGGQDAYFLSKYLSRQGVAVTGAARSGLEAPAGRFRHFAALREIDLEDLAAGAALIRELRPDYVLNFGAIAGSLTQQGDPEQLLRVNTGAVAAMLEAVRAHSPETVFLQASSSEVFAGGAITPQNLETARVPRTIYGVTKIASDNLVRVYRQSHGLSCHSLILFSHESPLRKDNFFSKRIVADALDLAAGKPGRLVVYSPDAVRDWGYAGEYCRSIVDMLLSGRAGDAILGSGTCTTVRQFAQAVCREAGLDYGTVAEEAPLQSGRAAEGVPVVADAAGPGFRFAGGVKFGIDRLARLLVRSERLARGSAGKNQSL